MIKSSKNVISKVYNESIAEELGIEVGDILLTIDDQPIVDIIDYLFLVSGDYVEVEIEKPDGEVWLLEIDKDYDEKLGIEFNNPILDKAKSCSNKCVFCFIDQMPKGMRKSLYFKDDDSRLSFLQGNFVTLTNVSDEDIDRIIRYKISPINVSIHTTNPDLRVMMLKNKHSGNLYERLKRLTDGGVVVYGQIVLCPDYNDGEELDRTIDELGALHPNLRSIAVVPIGLTKYREGLADVKPFDKEGAKGTIEQIKGWQEKYLDKFGTRFVFASDEFYVTSKLDLPRDEAYEGYPQIENGVGLMKRFETELIEALNKPVSINAIKRRVSLITGTAAFEYMRQMSEMVMRKYDVMIDVHRVTNNFFRETITVAGLLTGQDIVQQLSGADLGDRVLLPKVMFKSDEDIMLDDMSLSALEEALGTEVVVAKVEGKDFLDKVIF